MVLEEICRGQINPPFYATPWFMDILLHSTDNHIGYPLHFCQMWWLLTAVCRFYKIFTSAVDNIFSDADGGCPPPYRTWLNIELLNLPRLNDDNRILSGDCCLVCGMLFTPHPILIVRVLQFWHRWTLIFIQRKHPWPWGRKHSLSLWNGKSVSKTLCLNAHHLQ